MKATTKYTVAPLHPREAERLQSLKSTHLSDSEPSSRVVVTNELAAIVFNAPTVLISLVDANRQWCLSNRGLASKEMTHSVVMILMKKKYWL
jgi:hypothetical protein